MGDKMLARTIKVGDDIHVFIQNINMTFSAKVKSIPVTKFSSLNDLCGDENFVIENKKYGEIKLHVRDAGARNQKRLHVHVKNGSRTRWHPVSVSEISHEIIKPTFL